MFAVIKTGGKQYRVAANDLLKVEKVAGNVGDIVEFGQVLAFGEGDQATVGVPFVDGALVTAEVVEQGRGEKVIAFKKRRRQNSRRKRGHRQLLTTVRITEILTGGAKPSKKAATKAVKADVVDDIALIGGIGEVLKEKMTEAGFGTLKAISKLKKADIAKLDEELSLGGRIEREEWVEQAKELLAGKPPRAKVDQEAAAADKE
ncbi:50S ribosomal protein L21 [Arvimicrobium flavum]|uniref:50S ribosomal protein L21 n=1 Tax=Arvimicrobium flavum TaxID=3393320 RepID=UPI00237A1B0A|nr:50S ribosomal protein L21 [Mesorhizobium shangrilense]